MKRIALLLFAAILILPHMSLSVFADHIEVRVTLSDDGGAIVLAQAPVLVTDADGDRTLTMNDALFCAHEQYFEKGAEGYESEPSEYGRSLVKLWGVENGGSYGYYRNHASPDSLLAPISSGDLISAFVYTDLEAWSDTYCFFDADTADVKQGDTLNLTLSCYGYDADWNVTVLPVADAVMMLDGEETAYRTDAEGRVSIPVWEAGEHLISAKSETQTLIPPVLLVHAAPRSPETADSTSAVMIALLFAVMTLAVFGTKGWGRA